MCLCPDGRALEGKMVLLSGEVRKLEKMVLRDLKVEMGSKGNGRMGEV